MSESSEPVEDNPYRPVTLPWSMPAPIPLIVAAAMGLLLLVVAPFLPAWMATVCAFLAGVLMTGAGAAALVWPRSDRLVEEMARQYGIQIISLVADDGLPWWNPTRGWRIRYVVTGDRFVCDGRLRVRGRHAWLMEAAPLDALLPRRG